MACVPRRLRRELPGHDVHTVLEMRWSGRENGELLQLTDGQAVEVLRMVDQSMYVPSPIGVWVATLSAQAAAPRNVGDEIWRNRLPDWRPLRMENDHA